MSMTLPDLSFRLSYGPSEDRRRPATFPKALGFREGANLRRREGVGGGFARLEAGVAGLAGRPRWRHIRRGGGLQPSRKLRAFGKVPTYDVEKALGVVSPVSKQALLDLQADLAGGISAVAAACNLPESSELSGRCQPTTSRRRWGWFRLSRSRPCWRHIRRGGGVPDAGRTGGGLQPSRKL